MGSRLMHTIIAYEIASRLQIKDIGSFLLGAIAPDAVSPKDLSHFYKGKTIDYTRTIDHKAFLQKYEDHQNISFIQGYYTHLVADEIWLTGFFLPWLKNRMEIDSSIFERYHNDFKLLNAKLMNHYRINGDKMKDSFVKGQPVNLDEVSTEQLTNFLPYVEQDMKSLLSEDPLQVFTMEMIIGYMETSIDKGCQAIKQTTNWKLLLSSC
jgi:hypothetical protein